MRLVIGLGNPEKQYYGTNHNVGFDVVDSVSKHFKKKFKTKECDSLVFEMFVNGEKLVVAKPQTYMNNSGIAVKQLVRKYNVKPSTELIVVCDDYEIKEGTIRIRPTTSHTTHNGIKSIIEAVGKDFIKIKVSLGHKPEGMSAADFVLSKIKNEQTFVAVRKATSAVIDFINGKEINELMNNYCD